MLEPVQTQPVEVTVRFHPGNDVGAEHLWAEPLDAGDTGGTYRVLNNASYCPLLLDDVVRAELDADGLFQVTEFVKAGGRESVVVGVEPENAEAVARIADEWQETGAYSEGVASRAFIVARLPSPAGRPDDAELDALVASGLSTGWEPWRPADFGRHDELPYVDLRLSTVPDPERHPSHTTTYWAGDDPYWREHGMDDLDLLTHVQWLAENDVQVARALERGKHHQVLRLLEIMAMHPKDWPSDEQVFDPEDTAQDDR